jgi:hypothetical protein
VWKIGDSWADLNGILEHVGLSALKGRIIKRSAKSMLKQDDLLALFRVESRGWWKALHVGGQM